MQVIKVEDAVVKLKNHFEKVLNSGEKGKIHLIISYLIRCTGKFSYIAKSLWEVLQIELII
jgi:hypothetical protein